MWIKQTIFVRLLTTLLPPAFNWVQLRAWLHAYLIWGNGCRWFGTRRLVGRTTLVCVTLNLFSG